ncbi:MAG: hypothetical protein KF809_12420 [Chloroflexi bacterium]|nr:hypothetical protein [Chloroflexota bacterium]
MRNITVTVPDAVYKAARIRAAEADTSISALVAEYLTALAAENDTFSALEERQQVITESIGRFRAADRSSREDVHRRAVR